MDKYRPTRDLPSDLQEMDKSETACRFCGVSYLIHHEFKAMEQKLGELQEEIHVLAECKGNEKRLNGLLSVNESKLKETERELSEHRKRLMTSEQQVITLSNCLYRVETEKNEFCDRLKRHQGYYRGLGQRLSEFRQEVSEEYDIISQWKRENTILFKSLLQMVCELCQVADAEKAQYNLLAKSVEGKAHGEDQLRDQLLAQKNQLALFKTQLEEDKKKVEYSQEQLLLVNRQLHEEKEQTSCVMGVVRQLKDKINILEQEKRVSDELAEAQQSKRDLQAECNQLRSELTSIVTEKRALLEQQTKQQKELEAAQQKLAGKSEENESLTTEREKLLFAHELEVVTLKDGLHQQKRKFEKSQQELAKSFSEQITMVKRTVRALRENLRKEKDQVQSLKKRLTDEEEERSECEHTLTKQCQALTLQLSDLRVYVDQLQQKLKEQEDEADAQMSAHIIQVKQLEEKCAGIKVKQLRETKCKEDLQRQKAELMENFLEKEGVFKKKIQQLESQVYNLERTVQSECEERFNLISALRTAQGQYNKGGHASQVKPLTVGHSSRPSFLQRICADDTAEHFPSTLGVRNSQQEIGSSGSDAMRVRTLQDTFKGT